MLDSYWKVLRLFIIPFGGGIPAGVMEAKNLAIAWPVTVVLYFVSDVMLAIVFEPILLALAKVCQRFERLRDFSTRFRIVFQKSLEHYGTSTGPLALILVAFGVDPMTGRAVAKAAGHGFLAGWAIAITGDILYFGVIMVSTLWLNNIIGDQGQTTATIIFVLMIVVPILVKKIKARSLRP